MIIVGPLNAFPFYDLVERGSELQRVSLTDTVGDYLFNARTIAMPKTIKV